MLGGLYQRQRALGLDVPQVVATNDPYSARLLAFAGTRIVVVGPDKQEVLLNMLDDVIIKTRLGLGLVISVESFDEAVIVATKFFIDFGLTDFAVLGLDNAPLDWDEAAEVVTQFLKGKDSSSIKPHIKVDAPENFVEVLRQVADVELSQVNPFLAAFEVPGGSTPIAQKVGDVWLVSDESLASSLFMIYSPSNYVGLSNAKEILSKIEE